MVRRLNAAHVPTIAWLLLPREQGYWFNLGNAPQAAERYSAFLAWTRQHGLRWDGVGLDIEPDIHDMLEASHRPSRFPGGVVGLGALLLSLGRMGLARR